MVVQKTFTSSGLNLYVLRAKPRSSKDKATILFSPSRIAIGTARGMFR